MTFFHSKKSNVIKAKQYCQSKETNAPSGHNHSGKPVVRPIMTQGVIKGIEVKCSCGELITIHFEDMEQHDG